TGWEPDVQETIDGDCTSWCAAGLYYVPAPVEGVWQFDGGEVAFTQQFQMVSATVNTGGKPGQIGEGRLNGRFITFTADGMTYSGEVNGNRIVGSVVPATGGQSRTWTATKR